MISGSNRTGLGGGIYVADGSLDLDHTAITDDSATGPTGVGGGLYVAGGSVCMDQATLAAFSGNFATTSNNDIFGPFTLC